MIELRLLHVAYMEDIEEHTAIHVSQNGPARLFGILQYREQEGYDKNWSEWQDVPYVLGD